MILDFNPSKNMYKPIHAESNNFPLEPPLISPWNPLVRSYHLKIRYYLYCGTEMLLKHMHTPTPG